MGAQQSETSNSPSIGNKEVVMCLPVETYWQDHRGRLRTKLTSLCRVGYRVRHRDICGSG